MAVGLMERHRMRIGAGRLLALVSLAPADTAGDGGASRPARRQAIDATTQHRKVLWDDRAEFPIG
jgi:hypothetical protein